MKKKQPQSSVRSKRKRTASSSRTGKTSRINIVPAPEQLASSRKKKMIPHLFAEEKYRMLFSMTTDGIVVTDNAGRCLDANNSACVLFGYSHKELTSRSITDITAKEDVDAFRSVWKKFLKDGCMVGEFTVKTKSGNERLVEFKSIANFSPGIHVSTVRDLTEQREALGVLQKNEQRYRAFIQNSTEGIWCYVLKRPVDITLPVKTQIKRFFKDAFLQECNDEFAKMYGYANAGEIIGTRMEEIVVKGDPKNVQYLTQFIRSNYRLREMETVEQDRNGRQFLVINNIIGTVVDGKLIDAWGTQRDITEKKKAEYELRSTKDAYADLVHRIPFVVYKWRMKKSGEFILDFVSPRVKDLYGISDEYMLKNPAAIFELIHPDDRAAFIERNNHCARTLEVFTWEGRSLVNGVERWVQFNSTPRKLEDGDVLWDGILQETTERKQTEVAILTKGNEDRILAEAAEALAGFTTEESVFSYIATVLDEIVPNSIIILSAMHETDQTVRVRNISGYSGMLAKTARSILGFDPEKIHFKMEQMLIQKHSVPHLHRYENGIHEVAPTILTKRVASKLQSLLNFQDIYSIGITGNMVHGFIHLFCYDKHAKQNLRVIEPFVHLCTMSLEKIRSLNNITESERRYRLLADNATDVVWVMNFDGTFKYISPSILALRGFTVDELLSLPVAEHVLPSSRSSILPLIEKAKKVSAGITIDLTPDIFEIEQPCKDGTTVWVEVNAQVIFDDDRKPYGVLGVSHNITKRKRAEEELRRTNNENRFLVEASLALAGCSTEKDVYAVIRKEIQQLIPGCVLFIMNTSEDGQKSIVTEIAGIESSVLSAGMKLLRYDPIGKSFDNMKGWAELFCKPELHTFKGGLYELSSGVIPKFLAPKIEILLGVKGFHSIGIAEGNTYLGYIHIMTRQAEMPVLTSTIETFAHQCYLSLAKIRTQTKVAEEAHRRTTMMNTSGDGIAIINQEHRVVECNPQFARMLRYPPEELIGMYVWNFEMTMTESEIREKFADLLSINMIFEARHRRKDGTSYDVEVNASGTMVGNEPLVFVVCRDITERNDMIRALQESEEKHRTMFDTMAQGVVYHDRSGAIVSANPAAERLLGLSADQLMGRTSYDPRWHCIHEDGTPYSADTLPAEISLRTGKQVLGCMVGVFNVKLERYFWIIVDSVPQFRAGETTPYMVYVTFEDVTERKLIEEERRTNIEQIKLSEESYRGLFNSVRDAIYIQNERAEFLDVNDGAVKMYGYTRDEFVGKTPAYVSAPQVNDHFDFPEMIKDVMKDIPQHFEFWGRRKNGEIFPKNVSMYKGTYFGKPVIISMAQDITERKRLEKEQLNQFNELNLLYSLTNSATMDIALVQIYDLAVSSIMRGLSCDRSAILLFDAAGVLHFKSWSGLSERYRTATANHCPWSIDSVDPAPILVEDVNNDPSLEQYLSLIRDEGIRSLAFIPLKHNGRLIGKFMVYFNDHHVFTEQEIRLSETIALTIGGAIVRKQTILALRENEAKLRTIFGTMEEGLALNELVYNEHGDVVDYRILEVNPAFTRITNLEHNSIVGRLATDLYKMPTEYITRFWREHLNDKEAIKTDLIDDQTKRWRHVSTSIPVNGRFVTSFIDITDLKNAEQALRSSEQYNRSLHDTSPNSTTVSDLNGTIVYINKQALVMYGHDLNENLVGRNIFDWVPDHLRTEVAEKMKHLLEGKLLRNYQITAKRKNGDLFHAEINATLVPNSEGQPAFFLIISSDISERVKNDKEIRIVRKRLERAESVAQFGNWELDLNEKLIHSSDGAKKIYGVSENILPLETVQLMVLGEYRERMNTALTDLIERNIPYSLEFKIRRMSDGEILDIYSKAEYHVVSRKVFGVIHNITERKKAQEYLEQSEKRYRNIVDNLHQAYYESNSKAVFTYCNPGFMIMSGYTEDELLSKVSFKMVAPEHRRRVVDTYVQMMAEKRTDITIEFLIETKHGKKFWIEQISHFNFDGSGIFTKASHLVKDISERKQSHERLMESEQRYRQITEAITDYIYTVTMQDHIALSTKHGPGCLAVTGYSQDDFDQNRFLWYNMVVPEDRPIVERQLDRLFEQNASEPIEHRILRKDGIVRWVRNTLVPRRNETGAVLSYDGLIQDITERKEAEEKLRTSEERNRALVKTLPDLLFVHDEQGRFLDYHAPEGANLIVAFEAILGRTIEELIILYRDHSGSLPSIMLLDESTGKHYKESIELFLAGVLKPKMDRALKTGEMQHYEYCLDYGTEQLYYEARLVAFNDDKILNIIRDVTDRVRAENELRTLNEDLESRVVQRTAQLTEANHELEAFSYSVSHDLRAPLRAIDSFSAMLLEGNEDKFDDEGKRLISVIRTSIKKMDLLINGLLTLSRIGRSELHVTSIDMNALVLTLMKENLDQDRSGIYTIRIDDLPSVNGDESLIRQAMNNLISNAVKYSASVEHPTIEITGSVQEYSAVFTVKDNGAGFDPSKAGKLFGIFQRLHTDDQFKGLGIGLSIVQRIIHRHGGRVWADGKTNGGAMFSFSLPYGK
ncbi:MAG: PAS domain S-box protein [Bacteroidota bacterium]